MSVADGTTSIKFTDEPPANTLYGADPAALADYVDANGNLKSDYDAAMAHLGAPWRMMTKDELDLLVANCDVEWTDNWNNTGVKGMIVKGKGDYAANSVFFPTSGFGSVRSLNYADSYGCYWTSTPESDDSDCAWNLYFDESGNFDTYDYERCLGLSVRAVRDTPPTPVPPEPPAALAVKNVRTATHWPWDGKIDITCDLTGEGADGKTYTAVVENKPAEDVEEPVKAVYAEGLIDLATTLNSNVTLTVVAKDAADVADVAGSLSNALIAVSAGAAGFRSVSFVDLSVGFNGERQDDCELGQTITLHIPWPVTAGGDYGVVRIHNDAVQAIPQGEDQAVDGEYFTVDAAAGEIVLRVNKFSDYAIGATPAVEVTLPAGIPGVTYVVSNLTTGAEIPATSDMAGGASYLLPIGAKVSITAVRAPGYVFDCENKPIVIDSVTLDAAAMQALIDAGLPAPKPDGYLVYDFTASLKTTKGKKGTSKTTYTVNLGHDGNEYWWKALGYSDNKAAKNAVSKEFKACKTDAAKADYVLYRFGFDVTAAKPQSRWPIAEKYDARGNPKTWCHTLKFSLTSSGCYRTAGSVKLKDKVYIYTGSGDWSFADQKRWISVPLLHRFGGISLAKATKVEMVGGYEQDGRPLRMAGQGAWADKLGKDAKTGQQVGGLKSLNGNLVGVLPGPECESCCDYDEPALVFDCAGLPVDLTDPAQNSTAAFGTFSLKFNKKASGLK